ncbi:unnamed protein product [Clonostachys byssicola]|uniref:Uncharacterized protein n=1 Tax=Clonostachys byssicola TaxID=160290 RepID=A0A9N9UE26_9HYPO|nr:unnamed protein product [Clonostachys byssicola]
MHSLSGFLHRKDQPRLTTRSRSGHWMTTTTTTTSARPHAWLRTVTDWFAGCWGTACGSCRHSRGRNQAAAVAAAAGVGGARRHEDEEHEPLLECQRIEGEEWCPSRHNKRSSGASWCDSEMEGYVPSRAALSYLRTTTPYGQQY